MRKYNPHFFFWEKTKKKFEIVQPFLIKIFICFVCFVFLFICNFCLFVL